MHRWIGALTISLAVPALLAADASGTWIFSSAALPPDLTCELTAKNAELAGSCSAVKTRLPLADGRIDGRMVRWTINVPSDTGITTAYVFAAEMDESATTMEGTLTISSLIGTERGTFTAKKQ
jgi:hypothetical protein